MYLGEQKEKTQHTRTSKLGVDHNYYREKTVVVFRCDNCSEIFTRDRERMSPKRLNNNYFHCCSHCNPKRFAQKKGAERRTIWDRPASSLDDISRL